MCVWIASTLDRTPIRCGQARPLIPPYAHRATCTDTGWDTSGLVGGGTSPAAERVDVRKGLQDRQHQGFAAQHGHGSRRPVADCGPSKLAWVRWILGMPPSITWGTL